MQVISDIEYVSENGANFWPTEYKIFGEVINLILQKHPAASHSDFRLDFPDKEIKFMGLPVGRIRHTKKPPYIVYFRFSDVKENNFEDAVIVE